MFRRLWYYLRDVVWTAVGALALSGAGLLFALVGADLPLVLAAGLGAVALAVLAVRS